MYLALRLANLETCDPFLIQLRENHTCINSISPAAKFIPDHVNGISSMMGVDCNLEGFTLQWHLWAVLTPPGVGVDGCLTANTAADGLVVGSRRTASNGIKRAWGKLGAGRLAVGRLGVGRLGVGRLGVGKCRGDAGIVRRRADVGRPMVDVNMMAAGRRAGLGSSVDAQPSFDCCDLQSRVAIFAEKLVDLGDGATGVKTCTGVIDGNGVETKVVVPVVGSGHFDNIQVKADY